jgi:TonB family protein
MNPANAVAACAQVALLVAVCAGLPRVMGLRAPAVQYLFWRVLLAACLLLPILGPRQPGEMVFVPAPAAAVVPSVPVALTPVGPPAAPPVDWWSIAGLVITAGISIRLAWIALGVFRLQRMRTRARESAAGFDDLAKTIGVTAPILWSSDVAHPVTFGVFRPVVLLPIALKSVDAPAQRAVVAHELHHVKRRDWLWVVIEEVLRSVFWFHPAVWWLISRVQLARETVVDELSILTTNARRTYLDTLLAFADDTGLSPAFSARRHLFHRVMLLSKEGGMSSIRIAAVSCVLAVSLAAGSWGAIRAFPLYSSAQDPAPPPQAPPRDPLSPAAYHRLATEYFQKVVEDASLTEDQRLEGILRALAAEDRALELRPNYTDAMLFKAILLRRQANLTADPSERARIMGEAAELQGKAMALRRTQNGMPPPPPPTSGGGTTSEMVFVPAPSASGAFERPRTSALNPLRIGGNIKSPAKIYDVRPVYPPIARQARVTGVVILEVVIDADGNVAEGRVLRSIPLLDQAALDAVKEWRYEPTYLNGAPVPVIMTVTVNFNLQ